MQAKDKAEFIFAGSAFLIPPLAWLQEQRVSKSFALRKKFVTVQLNRKKEKNGAAK